MGREELLEGLREAQALMNKIINLQNTVNNASMQYWTENPYKKPLAKVWCGLIGLIGMIYLFDESPLRLSTYIFIAPFIETMDDVTYLWRGLNMAIGITLGIIVGVIIRKISVRSIQKTNDIIAEQNRNIVAHNQMLDQNIRELRAEILNVQRLFARDIQPWYPRDYCTLDAVAYFLNAVENYRASTVSEMTNLYEQYKYQQKMTQGQEALLKQQKINNLLTVGNIMMQGATLNALNENTSAVNNVGRAVNDVGRTVDKIHKRMRGY